MIDLDRVVHEPVRLRIMSILSGVDAADFKFMLSTLAVTKGNLASHVDKLERAGYLRVHKGFNGKLTHTEYRLTRTGRKALERYWVALDKLRTTATDSGPRKDS